MKKRLVSLALLLSMLLTAIPAVASAKTAEEIIAENAYDLHSLYVTDGLLSHFSVFGSYADTVSLEDGTWRDTVSGATATLGNKQYWERRADGAVGFDIYYGQRQADGSVLIADDPAAPFATDRYATGSAEYANTRLDLGISLLPKDDFTVEYVAKYNPVYVGTAEGGAAKGEDGLPLDYYLTVGTGLPSANLAGACDALGFFSSWGTERDGKHGTLMTQRGSIFWMLSDTLPTEWNEGDAWIGYDKTGGGGMRGAFHVRDNAHSYAIVRDETVEEKEGARTVKAVYNLFTDGTSFKKSLTVSTANDQPGRVYYDKDDTGEFYLSSQEPTDFYSIRIYDRLLTEAEKRQNRLVDLLLYYGITVREECFANEALMEKVYSRLEAAGFLSDVLAKEAVRAEVQSMLDVSGEAKDYVSLYAAQENLTQVFSSFDEASVDLDEGTWKSQNGSAIAELGEGDDSKYVTEWRRNVLGGIGYNTYCGQIFGAGGYSSSSAGNNYADIAAKLNFGINLLPESDFTVEFLAMYKPLYVYDPNEPDKVAKSADGTPLETYDYDKTSVGQQLNRTPFDQLGWFSSYAGSIDGVGTKPWSEARGALFWFFDCPTYYYYTSPHSTVPYNHNKNILLDGRLFWLDPDGDGKFHWYRLSQERGLNIHLDPWQVNNLVETYAITLDETLIIHEDGERETQGLFSLYRKASLYNSNKNSINTTATKTEYEGAGLNLYYDIDTPCDTAGFFLSATQPTDFFTVRIYDRALTEAEMAQNRAADMLYYYGVDFPTDLAKSPDALSKLIAACAEMSFEKDDLAREASKESLTSLLYEDAKTVTFSLDGSVYETVRLYGEKLTLPTEFLGKKVLAWTDAGDVVRYAPGEEVFVADGDDLTPYRLTLPATQGNVSAVSVLDAEAKEHPAVRYTASLSVKDYDALVSLFGADALTFGLLISPAYYVKRAGAFTREALTEMVNASASVSKAAYIEIRVSALTKKDDATYLIAGSVYDFKEATLKNDPAFAVIGFIEVDTDKNGTPDLVCYGSYVPFLNSTVKGTMQRAKRGNTEEAITFIDTLLSRFGA